MNRQYCYFCFIDEIGLCDLCIEEIDVCLNCIIYGNNNICNNCLIQDEAVVLDQIIVNQVVEWIRRNDFYWLKITEDSINTNII